MIQSSSSLGIYIVHEHLRSSSRHFGALESSEAGCLVHFFVLTSSSKLLTYVSIRCTAACRAYELLTLALCPEGKQERAAVRRCPPSIARWRPCTRRPRSSRGRHQRAQNREGSLGHCRSPAVSEPSMSSALSFQHGMADLADAERLTFL